MTVLLSMPPDFSFPCWSQLHTHSSLCHDYRRGRCFFHRWRQPCKPFFQRPASHQVYRLQNSRSVQTDKETSDSSLKGLDYILPVSTLCSTSLQSPWKSLCSHEVLSAHNKICEELENKWATGYLLPTPCAPSPICRSRIDRER